VTTQSFISKGVRGLAAFLCLAGAVTATAAQAGKPAADGADKAVRQRVEEYWKARSTMNLGAVQPFYEPEFRAKYAPEAFARDFRRLNRFAPEFLGIEGVNVDGKKAVVKVKLRTRPDVLQGQELISTVEEVWLNVDGNWFRQAEALLPNI
jgi:hypothetical protein